jgi:hypothetical protein
MIAVGSDLLDVDAHLAPSGHRAGAVPPGVRQVEPQVTAVTGMQCGLAPAGHLEGDLRRLDAEISGQKSAAAARGRP